MASDIRKCTITDADKALFPIKDTQGNYYLKSGYASCFKPVFGTGYNCDLVKLEQCYREECRCVYYCNGTTAGYLASSQCSFVVNYTNNYPSLGAIKEVVLDVSSRLYICNVGHHMCGAKTYTENWYVIPAGYYGALQFYTLLSSLPKATWQKTSQSTVSLVRKVNSNTTCYTQPNCIVQAPYPSAFKQFNCVMVCCNVCTGIGAILFSNAAADATARVGIICWIDTACSLCGDPPYMCRWGCSTGYDTMLAVTTGANYTCSILTTYANQMNTFGVLVPKTICIC